MTGGMSVAAMEWLEARGLDVELCDRLGLFVSSGTGDKEALAYPLRRKGIVLGHKYRPLVQKEGAPRFWRDKGCPAIAFNEDCLRDEALIGLPLVITEGYEDCASVLQAGFVKALSVPDGAPPNPVEDLDNSTKYAWLDELIEEGLLKADRVPIIILAVDGDPAGAALLHDLSHKLGRARCKFVTYPKATDPQAFGRDRLKDCNETLMQYGVRGVRAVIERAQFLKITGVLRLSELPPAPENTIYEIGFEALGEHMKLRTRDMSVWTGIGGYGKSTLLNDILCRVCLRYGTKVAWFSPEQDPVIDHRRHLRQWFCEEWEFKLTSEQVWAADEWIERHHLFIVPEEDEDATLNWLLDRMEAAVIQHGCKFVVIDPFNEIEDGPDHGENEVRYINRTVRTLRRFAKRFDIHLVVVAHPTKMPRTESGTYMMPGLMDVSGGAVWRNKATQGVIVHKTELDSVLVKVDKSKYWSVLGKPGTVKMAFSQQTQHFTEEERGIVDIAEDRPPRRGRRG